MNIALCFCVRNCEKYLPAIFKNIDLFKTLDVNVYSIFAYDNCKDQSEKLLFDYKELNKDNVIIINVENNIGYRTERIAKARNSCLDVIYNKLKDISFHIMIDSDDRCSKKWDVNIINKYLNNFDNDNWDCISFNRKDYYDIWALLDHDIKEHCWGFGKNSNNVIRYMKHKIKNRFNNKTNSINVISAFCGLCIYNTKRFKGFHYDGLYKNFKELITDEERNKTIENLKNVGLNIKLSPSNLRPGNSNECCEYLYYHLSAFKEGRIIKISKFRFLDL